MCLRLTVIAWNADSAPHCPTLGERTGAPTTGTSLPRVTGRGHLDRQCRDPPAPRVAVCRWRAMFPKIGEKS
jgi:hypothetical protein